MAQHHERVAAPGRAREVPPSVHAVLQAPGNPLDRETREAIEPVFGRDFSRVRVHTDTEAAQSTATLRSSAYTVGHHVVFGAGRYAPRTAPGRWLLAHELTHVVQQANLGESQPEAVGQPHDSYEDVAAQKAAETVGLSPVQETRISPLPRPTVQRVTFGNDGPLMPSRKAVVKEAASVAERLVTGGGGIPTFRRQWEAFWSGPGARIQPKPTLEAYQAAVRTRVINDMDTTSRAEVREVVTSEQQLPLERQTAAVTPVGSIQTYMRGFAIDQGVDSVASTLLHEALHGAGLPMGPALLYEPIFHQFEADVGFPMMMGGADILDIKQARRGDTDLEVTVTYALRQVGNEEIPRQIEIQVVSPESGETVTDEQPGGERRPARQAIPSRAGQGRWVWHARNPGVAPTTVRLRDMTSSTLLASKGFTPNPRCVIGVSTMHCEGEE